MCWKNTCASIWGRRVARGRSASETWWRSPVSSGDTCADKHLTHLRQRDFLSGVFADLPPAHCELTGRKTQQDVRSGLFCKGFPSRGLDDILDPGLWLARYRNSVSLRAFSDAAAAVSTRLNNPKNNSVAITEQLQVSLPDS